LYPTPKSLEIHCLSLTLQTEALLGSFAISLLGFRKLMFYYDHVPIMLLLIIVHDKDHIVNWNMERTPRKTVLPQGWYGTPLAD
jgi:hypothetical protein